MSAPVHSEDGVRRPLLADQRNADETAESSSRTFKRNLGASEAFAIVISIVIGSGIFTSPGAIDSNVPSPGVALIIWLVGGILAWTGATTMAELGTAIPGEGGVQPYLQYIFGDVFGFLAAWTWIIAIMPATLAILSIAFIDSIYSAAGFTNSATSIERKLLSILVLVVISLANSISTKATTRLNNFFVVTKFVSIAGIVIAGIVVIIIQTSNPNRNIGGRDWFTRPWFGYRETVNPDGTRIDWTKLQEWEILGHYSAALYGALWAYSGWDKAIYISAELSSPARQLPLALNTAIPTIILCFIAANAIYYILLPWNLISSTNSVAVTAISRLLGPAAGVIAAILICLVIAGSLLGNSFVAGRMVVSASNKNWLPGFLGFVGRIGVVFDSITASEESSRDSPDVPKQSGSDAPINAIILETSLAALYILLGNFRALLTFNGLGEYSFFFITVLGAVILRFRQRDLHRPYKPLVIVPIVFAVVSGFVVVRGAVFAPVQATILISLWAIGLVFYWVRRRWIARGLNHGG
ncbi:amino acid transporter [Paecilomyces variotii]|uniref:Amino acid transporter n=1 Tax=Byssochlamys spectabilis TaxID=264951 RepID=A0A443HL58_BYSSP|nr:amino acid transporter [Paecilomyces variotii]KAJ9353484.1 hypothetical protein DTO280E4_7307 [Paecilomyces variotii]KAJ9404851.1 hypothetical protein DTO045G8_7423 [Paecilomyces variotii]RWQ92547.1 amino acid transporter [Paecilomyces variotii]